MEEVPDPRIQEPTDALVEISSTAICGSDLHLYGPLTPFMERGDVLGHEPMGRIVEVGSGGASLDVGDRVVIPFNISCGPAGCANASSTPSARPPRTASTARAPRCSATPSSTGTCPGPRPSPARAPGPVRADQGAGGAAGRPLPVPSDVLPTAWQAVDYADVPDGGSLLVLGPGPIGQMAVPDRPAPGRRAVVVADLVAERLAMADQRGRDDRVRASAGERRPSPGTDRRAGHRLRHRRGRHGSPRVARSEGPCSGWSALLPRRDAEPLMKAAGIDRLTALRTAIDAVRRGGTLSISGVYGGAADPIPMLDLFDKGIQVRMGQAHVRRWVPEILPLLEGDGDPLGLSDFVTHRLPLDDAPRPTPCSRPSGTGPSRSCSSPELVDVACGRRPAGGGRRATGPWCRTTFRAPLAAPWRTTGAAGLPRDMRIRSDRTYHLPGRADDVWRRLARIEDYRSWWPWLRRFEARRWRPATWWRCTLRPRCRTRSAATSRWSRWRPPAGDRRTVGRPGRRGLLRAARRRARGTEVRLVSDLAAARLALRLAARLLLAAARRGHDRLLDAAARQFAAG